LEYKKTCEQPNSIEDHYLLCLIGDVIIDDYLVKRGLQPPEPLPGLSDLDIEAIG
jgi:hypothetical protein